MDYKMFWNTSIEFHDCCKRNTFGQEKLLRRTEWIQMWKEWLTNQSSAWRRPFGSTWCSCWWGSPGRARWWTLRARPRPSWCPSSLDSFLPRSLRCPILLCPWAFSFIMTFSWRFFFGAFDYAYSQRKINIGWIFLAKVHSISWMHVI